MWFIDTKESVPTIGSPHDAIILFNHPTLSAKQKDEGLIFLSEEIQTNKIFLRVKSFQEISIEAPLITYILVDHFHQHRFGQDSTVVLSFQQSPCDVTGF